MHAMTILTIAKGKIVPALKTTQVGKRVMRPVVEHPANGYDTYIRCVWFCCRCVARSLINSQHGNSGKKYDVH